MNMRTRPATPESVPDNLVGRFIAGGTVDMAPLPGKAQSPLSIGFAIIANFQGAPGI